MKKSSRFLIPVLSAISCLWGQDYTWPVDLPRAISSNFAEFRPGRFHAGLDIRTNGSIGHEVYAVSDGYIWRVRVSSDGYGRALYLKLHDGNLAVYAHLDRFVPILNDIVKLEQQRRNSYGIDRYFGPDQFLIHKGDLIAFTGESGIAFAPHLHFELRDTANRPLNPLTNGFSIKDGRLPVPEALAIVPLSQDALINGSPLPQIFPLRRTKTREYVFPDTIHVFGSVGLEISALDRISGMSNEFNIHGAVLSVDGLEQYRIEFTQFAFQQSRLIEIERDNSLQRLNKGEFHRLFVIDRSSQLDFVSQNSRGRLSLTPGYHHISIKLYDSAKNLVRVRGVLYQAPPTNIHASITHETSTIVTVKLEPEGSPFPLKDFACYSFNTKGFVEEQIDAMSRKQEERALIIEVPGSAVRQRILQFIGINTLGAVSKPFHLPVSVHEADYMTVDLDLIVRHLENTVILEIETESYTSEHPQIVLRGLGKDDVVKLERVSPTTFLTRPLKPDEFAGTQEVIVSIQGSPVKETRFSVRPKLATGTKLVAAVSPDGNCSIQVLPHTFYATTAFWIETVNRPVPVEGGTFKSQTYQLQPFDRPLQDSARVAIALSESIHDVSRLGIFYYDQKEGWTYLPSRFSKNKWMFFTSLYSLEAVSVIQDTVRPIIRDVFPGNGGKYQYQDLEVFSAVVDDKLSGIKNDKAISMMLDGKKLLLEYQPVKKTATVRLDTPLGSGEHLLVITAIDQVGNSSTKEISFSVN